MSAMPQSLPSSGNLQTPTNENFAAAAWAWCYTVTPDGTAGLIRKYSGGRWGGFAPVDVSHTFGASVTTYVSVDRSDGSLDFSTSSTNYNDSTNYAKVETVVTGASAVTSTNDDRGGPGGVHGGSEGSGLSSRIGLTFEKEFALSDLVTDLTTGTTKGYWRPTFDADGVSYRLSLLDASSSGAVTVDMNKNGSTMTATPASVQATEFDSATGVAPTMTDPDFADGDLITWDIDAAGADAKGLIVTVTGVYQS